MEIILEDSDQPYLAAVSYTINPETGKAENIKLHIDVKDFSPATLPNGGTVPIYNDRIIAHELVHAVMGRNMDYGSLPKWFKEGVAEFIHGGDERLKADLASMDGNHQDRAKALVALIGDGTDTDWINDSAHYSSAYGAIRYLHALSSDNGGIRGILQLLKEGKTLDDAINLATRTDYSPEKVVFNDTKEFIESYKDIGSAYIVANLDNNDTGAIGGYDADGGPRDTTPEGVIPDTYTVTLDPLIGFNEIWPSDLHTETPVFEKASLKFHIGANMGQTFDFELIIADSQSLGVANINLINSANEAITKFDMGIKIVSSERSRLGALQNRFEHSLNINSIQTENLITAESRIRDVDMAKELMEFTKNNILQQAAQAMLAQANQKHQGVLQLLN